MKKVLSVFLSVLFLLTALPFGAVSAAANSGDASGDGKVNIRDMGLLQQYLNERDVTLDITAADVVADDKTNIRDLGLLQQYLNGWDVKVGDDRYAGGEPVPSDGRVVATVDKGEVGIGETVTLTVSMENNPGLVGWLIHVDFDEDVLELIKQERGDAFVGITFGPMQNPANALWCDYFYGENCTNNGVIFTLTFRVKDNAVFGESAITVYCTDPDNLCNSNYEAVEFEFVSTAVTVLDHSHIYDNSCDADCNICGAIREDIHSYDEKVVVPPTCVEEGWAERYCIHCGATTSSVPIAPTGDHIYSGVCDADCNICGAVREVPYISGDANGDGKVNVRDLALMERYLNKWDVEIALDACDVTGDGKINVRDPAHLERYLNGWDVTLGG